MDIPKFDAVLKHDMESETTTRYDLGAEEERAVTSSSFRRRTRRAKTTVFVSS